MNTSKPIVKISHLHKVFRSGDREIQALSDINLTIQEGTFVSIIGPSGCGKSTLLRIIGGLDSSYDGEVLFDGEPVQKPSRDKGFIFQDRLLLPWLTVSNNIRFALPPQDKKNSALIQENINLVGLEGFENSLPKELSGGMAQRAEIARALANRPRILLLDEPFSSLDAITKIRLQDQLLRIWQQEAITMVIVTHDIDEAVYLGGRVVLMQPHPGRIQRLFDVDLGTPRQRTGPLFSKARDLVFAEFFHENHQAYPSSQDTIQLSTEGSYNERS